LSFGVALFILPLLSNHPYVLRILTIAAIFAIFAASWDLLAGFTGQLCLGQSLFFGVAGYTVGLLNNHFHLSPWFTIPIGGIAAVLAGIITALPALRLRGFYLALVTLAFPLILMGILFMFPDFTGGEYGLYGIDRISSSLSINYYVINLVMVVSLIIMWKLTDARSKIVRLGVILHAIRDDEVAARVAGINTTNYKLLAFSASGFFAGIAGGLYAHYFRIVGPSTLELFFSFQVILWTIFGGIGTISGAVVGVYFLYPLTEILSANEFLAVFRHIVFCVILIFTLLFMPEGVTVWVRDRIEEVCPRCKVTNAAFRKSCRACSAPLHLAYNEHEAGGVYES
jgi:branched-chain amino acid transport system permease protein